MGLSCPVCEDPQADAKHLANHLAITALTRGGDHEEWLVENVTDWQSLGEEELAERVKELAEPVEYPTVFEDTTDQQHETAPSHSCGHSHAHTGAESDPPDQERGTGSLPDGAELFTGQPDGDETAEAIKEAMEMTRTRRERSEQETHESADNSETE